MKLESKDFRAIQAWVFTAVTALLVFFLKRGVDKFDSIEQNVVAISRDVIKLKVKLCAIEKFKLNLKGVDRD